MVTSGNTPCTISCIILLHIKKQILNDKKALISKAQNSKLGNLLFVLLYLTFICLLALVI